MAASVSGKPGRPFGEIKPMIRTLDLIMFRGGDIVSDFIAKVEAMSVKRTGASTYTHVGLAVWGRDLGLLARGFEETLLVFESTLSGNLSDGVKDIYGRAHLGVQLRNLEEVVVAYDSCPTTHMAWLPVQEDRRVTLKLETLPAIYGKYKDLFYDASALDLLAAAAPMFRPVRDCAALTCVRDKFCQCFCCCCKKGADAKSPELPNRESNWQFCSELAANVYKDIGLLPQDVNSQDVLPCDFLPASSPGTYGTLDVDKKVPWLFNGVVQFHK